MTLEKQELDRIETAKTAIGTAIAGKGVAVPSGTKLDGMAALIDGIEQGSGGGSGGGSACAVSINFYDFSVSRLRDAFITYTKSDGTSTYAWGLSENISLQDVKSGSAFATSIVLGAGTYAGVIIDDEYKDTSFGANGFVLLIPENATNVIIEVYED